MSNIGSSLVSHRFQADPALVARVDEWLKHRNRWAPRLEAITEELPAGGYRRSLVRLARQLRSGAAAETLCGSRSRVVTLLPLLADIGDEGGGKKQLNRVLSESLRNAAQRRRRRWMLAYPFMVVLMAFLVFAFLSLTVTPVFERIFDSFGLELPALTEGVLLFGWALREGPLVTVLGFGAVVAAACWAWRQLQENGPLIPGGLAIGLTRGNSPSVAGMAGFVHRLAEGLAARLPMPVAMRTAGDASGIAFLRRTAHELADELAGESDSIVESKSVRRCPAMLIHLLDQPGVDPRDTARRLHDYADLLSERVESRFDWSTGIIVQASVVFVGAVVVLVVLALFAPLLMLVEGLT